MPIHPYIGNEKGSQALPVQVVVEQATANFAMEQDNQLIPAKLYVAFAVELVTANNAVAKENIDLR